MRTAFGAGGKGDVMLGDRGFCSYAALGALSQRGIDSVMRLHQARKISFREGRHWAKTIAWSLEKARRNAPMPGVSRSGRLCLKAFR